MKNKKSIALSNYNINNILKNNTIILTYSQLSRFNNIYDLLKYFDHFILLYLSKLNFGHWVCVINHPDRIEFFDPYGGSNIPDSQLDKINKLVKYETNQDYPYLSKLLYESEKAIEYNNYQFQEKKNDINTCGRHCIVRVLLKNMLLDDYYKYMNKLSKYYNLNFDDIVTLITENI
jgi:hypothetical protein